MIIWGSRAKEKTLASGSFFCPSCQLDTSYDHIRVSNYFTLYFIPTFPMENLGEYVKCRHCQATYEPSILNLSRIEILEATQPWLCARCQNKNPASEGACVGCGTARADAAPSAQYDMDDE